MSWTATDPVKEQDAERIVVDYLGDYDQLDAFTKGVSLPNTWKPKGFPIHLQVACDGEFLEHPVRARSTVRVVAWGYKPTEVRNAAHLAQGLLLAEPNITSLTGVLSARDDETHAELAYFTVRVRLRSTSLA